MKYHPEFTVPMLNESGERRAHNIAGGFDDLLDIVEAQGVTGRMLSLVKTKLEEACFFAKKGIAELPENQE